jgi:hypothetical protein
MLVDTAEPVQIDDGDAQWHRAGNTQRFGQLVAEAGAIQEAGQRIVKGQPANVLIATHDGLAHELQAFAEHADLVAARKARGHVVDSVADPFDGSGQIGERLSNRACDPKSGAGEAHQARHGDQNELVRQALERGTRVGERLRKRLRFVALIGGQLRILVLSRGRAGLDFLLPP